MERTVNLVEERVDLAIRIGRQLDDGLVSRNLGVCRSVVCASPAYLKQHGTPREPHDLSVHRCVTHAWVGRNEFVLMKEGETLRVPVQSVLQCNETAVTCRAALDGGGIALLPTYFVANELRRGELVRLLPEYEPEAMGIHAAYLSRTHQPLLLRRMIDFLAQRFSGERAQWDAQESIMGTPR